MEPTKEQVMLDLISQARECVENIERLLNEVDCRMTELKDNKDSL